MLIDQCCPALHSVVIYSLHIAAQTSTFFPYELLIALDQSSSFLLCSKKDTKSTSQQARCLGDMCVRLMSSHSIIERELEDASEHLLTSLALAHQTSLLRYIQSVQFTQAPPVGRPAHLLPLSSCGPDERK